MKYFFLIFLVPLFALQERSLGSQEDQDKESNIIITVQDYGAFLNAIPEAEVTNDDLSATGQLLVLGKPGSYRYEVARGTDPMAPMTLLNWEEAADYCDFKNATLGAPHYVFLAQGGVEGSDHFLKSNLFTFCLVPREALAHEASGEGVALDGLFEAVEEAAFGALILSGTDRRPTGSGNSFSHFDHERSERTIEESTAFPNDAASTQTATSLFTEPAYLKEKKKTAQLLQQLIEATQRENNTTRYLNYYKEADQYWEQDQQAWEERTVAQHTLELKNAARLQAEKHFVLATEERSKTDTQKTLLARIARVTGKVAMPLSFIPGPIPLGGIAHTISEVTGRLNQVWVEKDVILAERAAMQAIQEVEQASKNANVANERAAVVRKKAQEAEEHARLLEIAARKDDRTRFYPPVMSMQEADWKEWTIRLVQAAQGDPASIPNLINHGMSDPLWMDAVVTRLLSQHIEKQNELQEIEERLEPFERAFQEASQRLQEAQHAVTPLAAAATTAQQRFEAATQIYEHWKSELKETNELLNELEKPENARKPETAKAIAINKEKFSAALTHFEKATNDLQTCEKTRNEAAAVLALEEANILSLQSKATIAEEQLLRNRERVALYQEEAARQQPTLRLPRGSETGTMTREKLTSTAESILFPPEVLSKVYETIGKAFLNEKHKEPLKGEQEPTVPRRLPPEIREPSSADLARWEAGERAQEVIEERNEVIATIKRRILTHPMGQELQEEVTTALNTIHEEEGSEEERDETFTPLLPRKFQRKGESSRVSSVTTKTKSEKSQSSIGSFVSKNSIHSWSGSVAGSIPASVTSSATKSELKNLKKTTRAITETANQWAVLVRQADAERVAAGGMPYAEEESLFEAWQESDVIAQAAWKKRCDIQTETLRTAAQASTWDRHTARWEARAEADRLHRDQEEAERDLNTLTTQQNPSDLSWLSSFQTASTHFQEMEKAALEAEKKWNRLAELELTIQQTPEKEQKDLLLRKLRERDQAIMALWEQVKEDYYAEKEEESRRAAKARLAEETNTYQFDLITEKINRVAACFAKADAVLSHGEAREALEKEAIEKYTEATVQEALEAAWKKIPGAITAWEFRVAKAEKEYRLAEQKSENAITIARLAALAEADRKGLEVLQQETKEFADMEAAWRTALQEEEKATFLKQLAAARAYHQGDLALWHALPHQERELYNEAIVAANEAVIDIMQSRLQEAWENTQEWHQKATKAWKIFSKKSMEQLSQKAIAELTQLKTQEDQRRVAIRQAKIVDFDYQKAQEENEFSFEKDFLQKLIALRTAAAEQAMREANAFCDEIEIAWAQKADVVYTGYNQAAHYVERVGAVWGELAEEQRTILEKLSAGQHQELMAASLELIKAEEEKEAWRKKKMSVEKIAHVALDPHVGKVKTVFETIRSAWEILRHPENIENTESVLFTTKLIKEQVATVETTHLDDAVYQALIGINTTAEALGNLSIAARNHARMRAAALTGSGSTIVTSATAAMVMSSATAVVALTMITAGVAAAPIGAGAIYYGYKYYKKRYSPTAPVLGALAPRTTEAILTKLHALKESIEATIAKTADTIWAADTTWCREAIREAQELVRAMTYSAPAVEEVAEGTR